MYAPPGPGDGLRVLVTRWWPRGVRRHLVHEWRRELAPSAGLLREYKAGMPWGAYVESYVREMESDAARAAISGIRSRAASSDVTLLCYEPDGERCHRHILSEMVAGRPVDASRVSYADV